MVHADDLGDIHVQDKNGKWHLARPIEFSSILRRVKDAWKVLKGDYVAVKFWSESEKHLPRLRSNKLIKKLINITK